MGKAAGGPLDAWIKSERLEPHESLRTNLQTLFSPFVEGSTVPISKPKVLLPKPVGESKSGATRLSELRSRKVQSEECTSGASSSKFFQSKSRRTAVARKTESIVVDLVLEDEPPEKNVHERQASSQDETGTTTSDLAASVSISMPPSPVCSTIFSSPMKAKSERADSPLSSPESSNGHDGRQRSTAGFTSPSEENLDIFEGDQQVRHPPAIYRDAEGTDHPPTPSPSNDANGSGVIAPHTPDVGALSQQEERTPTQHEAEQKLKKEIDLSRFYPKDDMVTSPIEVVSDIETDVEETQRETMEEISRRAEQEEKKIKAVAAGWKAKYTFGGIVS